MGVYGTILYFRSYPGNACHSDYCCVSRYLLFPADGGTPIQLYTRRRRMKMSYFRYWGRHQKSATLPRSLRIQLGEWPLCVILLCGGPVQAEALRSDQLGLFKKYRIHYGTRSFATFFTWTAVTSIYILFQPACWQRNWKSKRSDDIRRRNVHKNFQKFRQCINRGWSSAPFSFRKPDAENFKTKGNIPKGNTVKNNLLLLHLNLVNNLL
jgi:hypothetical protein